MPAGLWTQSTIPRSTTFGSLWIPLETTNHIQPPSNIWILRVDVICSLSFNRCLGRRRRLRWKENFHKEQASDKEDATGKAARHEDQQPMYTWPFLGAWSRKTRQLKLEIQDVCTNVGTGGQILVDRSLHLLQSHGCGCPVAGKSQGWKRTTASILHKYHLFHVK